MARILIIDDNETIREGMAYAIQKMGHEVSLASGGRQGLVLFEHAKSDLVITDLKMDEIDGMEVLLQVQKMSPNTLVIMVTAFGTIEVAVEAMKQGAFDFIAKPFSMDLLKLKVEKALSARVMQEKNQLLQEENNYLKEELSPKIQGNQMIGNSQRMQKVFQMIQKIAKTDSTVHIYGESGTGKELVARAIHEQSSRCNGPFIKVNCGAIAETLLETELFGHEKGAFTNAIKRRIGRFELAHGGTLFLDEIGDITPSMQVKLLRVLQEKELERVGGEKSIQVDVRIVSATNKELHRLVEEDLFREDLMYRLLILPIHLPPLRERKEDIPLLVSHFLEKLKKRTFHQIEGCTDSFLQVLQKYQWPGNIRELENVLEQCLVFADGDFLQIEDLPSHLSSVASNGSLDFQEEQKGFVAALGQQTLPQILDDLEFHLICKAYEQSGKVKAKTARMLGIKTSALYYKLEKYNIDTNHE